MNRALYWISRSLFIILLLLFSLQPSARAQPRWKVARDGGIVWEVQPGDVHQDHIEMSGRRVSVTAGYGVSEKRSLILPPPPTLPPFPTFPHPHTLLPPPP